MFDVLKRKNRSKNEKKKSRYRREKRTVSSSTTDENFSLKEDVHLNQKEESSPQLDPLDNFDHGVDALEEAKETWELGKQLENKGVAALDNRRKKEKGDNKQSRRKKCKGKCKRGNRR